MNLDITKHESMLEKYTIIKKLCEEHDTIYEEQILLHNEIEHILSLDIKSINQTHFYYYDIYQMCALEELITEIDCDDLIFRKCMTALEKSIINMNEYLLVPESLYISESTIYYHKSSQKFYFIYVPGYNENLRDQMKNLLEWMMKTIDYSKRNTVNYVYELYQKLEMDKDLLMILKTFGESIKSNSEDHIVYEKNLKESEDEETILKQQSIKQQSIKQAVNKTVIQNQRQIRKNQMRIGLIFGIAGASVDLLTIILKNPLLYWMKKHMYQPELLLIIQIVLGIISLVLVGIYIFKFLTNKSNTKLDEGIEEFWEPIKEIDYEGIKANETVILDEKNEGNFFGTGSVALELRNINDHESSWQRIDQFPCVVGKNEKTAQFVINEGTISRRHAIITREYERFYIQDLYSLNGSFIDNNKMIPDKLYELNTGNHLKFANIEIEVNILGG